VFFPTRGGETRSVLSRVAKPLFGLIVLLACPWLGLGGSARAGFVITLGTTEAAFSDASSAGTAEEDRPGNPEWAWLASLPPQLLPAGPAPQASSTTGGMTTSASPTEAGGGGLVGLLMPDRLHLQEGEAGLLFLGDERFKPPPFASRLFRPPRRS